MFLSGGANKVSGWSHRQGRAVKGTELGKREPTNHLTKMAIVGDFSFSGRPGKQLAGSSLPDRKA